MPGVVSAEQCAHAMHLPYSTSPLNSMRCSSIPAAWCVFFTAIYPIVPHLACAMGLRVRCYGLLGLPHSPIKYPAHPVTLPAHTLMHFLPPSPQLRPDVYFNRRNTIILTARLCMAFGNTLAAVLSPSACLAATTAPYYVPPLVHRAGEAAAALAHVAAGDIKLLLNTGLLYVALKAAVWGRVGATRFPCACAGQAGPRGSLRSGQWGPLGGG